MSLTARVGPDLTADHVTVYYTTDGSEPVGARGAATNGQALFLELRPAATLRIPRWTKPALATQLMVFVAAQLGLLLLGITGLTLGLAVGALERLDAIPHLPGTASIEKLLEATERKGASRQVIERVRAAARRCCEHLPQAAVHEQRRRRIEAKLHKLHQRL